MGQDQGGCRTLKALVLVTCRWLNATADGALLQGRALASAGIEVAFAGIPGSPVLREAGRLGFRCYPARLDGAYFPLGLLRLREAIGGFRPGCLCAHRSEDQAAAVLLRSGLPLVRVRSDIRRPGRGALRAWIDRRTDLVVAASGFMLREGYMTGRRGPVDCIPCPVDTGLFAPAARRPEGVIVSAGRLSEVKGHKVLLRALAELPGVRALIAGAQAQQDAESLGRFAETVGVRGRVEFLGRVDDMPSFYARGTIGVVTSLGSEAVSRAAAEMLASGLPVLAAATNGLPDLVIDGRTGLLHPPGDWEILAAQARHLLDNPSAAAYLSANGRGFCEREISIPAVGRRWVPVLLRLMKRNNSGSPRVSPSEGADNPLKG